MMEPIPFELNDAALLRIIRKLAQDSANIFLSRHAVQRMRQRRITRAQIEYCLRNGSIDEAAHRNIRGNWQCRMQCVHAGDWIRVAVALQKDEAKDWIAVITVF